MPTLRTDRELKAAERYDARRAMRLLEGTGWSLSDAARIAMESRGVKGRMAVSATIDAAIEGFLQRALARNLREQTYDFYEVKLSVFSRRFHGLRLDDVSRDLAVGWITSLTVSVTTQRGYLRAVHALYAWARGLQDPLCVTNPVEGVKLEQPLGGRDVDILQANEVAAILAAAGPYRYALALMVFAGIRPHEIAGRRKPPLEWRHVDRGKRMIRIPPEIAKTRGGRILEKLPPVVWAWLKGAPKAGPVCPGLSRQAVRCAWETLCRMRPEAKRWPQDVLRHTAASYMLRLWHDIGRVSEVIGHEGRTNLLRQRYLALMTQAEAKAIAALRPERSPNRARRPTRGRAGSVVRGGSRRRARR